MTRATCGFALALGLSAPGAWAATICVTPPSVTTCPNHTIQSAVNLAAAGDIVQVGVGTYFEAVTVPAGKDGLQINGVNKLTTIIDHDVPNAGSIGITVSSNAVKISNLTIQNGTNWGISATGSGEVVSGVRVFGVRTPGSGGILVNGNNPQVLLSEVRATAQDGIVVTGSGALIKGNTVSQVTRLGILLNGGAGQVLSNKISNAGVVSPFAGLLALGPGNVVTSNTLENVGSGGTNALGLTVTDNVLSVTSNKLTWAGSASLTCTGCNGGKVAQNVVSGSSGIGLQVVSAPVVSPAAVLAVQGNKVNDAAQQAFLINGPTGLAAGAGIDASLNSATDSGFLFDCFRVVGSGHTLATNIAASCGGAAFYSKGDDFAFTGNTASGAATSGFVVDGDNGGGPAHFGATLTSNKVSGAFGQAFALFDSAGGGFDPVGTTGASNVSLPGNRQDFCNEGAAVTIGAFSSVSTTCDIR